MQGGYKAAAMSGIKSAPAAQQPGSNGSGANANNTNGNGVKKTNAKKKPTANGKANGNGAAAPDAAASSRAPPPGFAPPASTKAPVPNAWATPLTAVAAPVGFSDSQQRLLRHRALFVFRSLVGKAVEVTLVDASRFVGILDCIDPDDFSIVLKNTQRKEPKETGADAFDSGSTVIFKRRQLVDMVADGVVNYTEGAAGLVRGVSGGVAAPGFRTDTEITNRSHDHLYGRELESAASWLDPQLDSGDLEENASRRKSGWNQFDANEKLFGVVSTFDENLYTTKLDKTKISNEKSREAERLAREIERETTGNFHLQEERGQAVHGDDDLDEEAKYSSVDRKAHPSATRSAGAYVPPALRNASRPTSAGPTKPKPISPKPTTPAKPATAAPVPAAAKTATTASAVAAPPVAVPTPAPAVASTDAPTQAPNSSPAGPTPAADSSSQPRKPISFSEAVTGRPAARPSPTLAPASAAAAPSTVAEAPSTAKAPPTKQERKPSTSPKKEPAPKSDKPATAKPTSPTAGKKEQKASSSKGQSDKKATAGAPEKKGTEPKSTEDSKAEKKAKAAKTEASSKSTPTAPPAAAAPAETAPSSEPQSTSTAAPATPAKKTSLNPKAKEFKLSAAAPTFTPKFGMPTAAPAPAPVAVPSSPYRQPNAGHYGHMHPPPPHPAMAGMGYAPGPEEWMYDGGMMLDESEYAAAAAHAYMGYGMPMMPNPAMMQQPMYAPMMPPQQNVRMGRHGGGGGGGYGYNQPGMYNHNQRGYYGQGAAPGAVPYQGAPGTVPGGVPQPPLPPTPADANNGLIPPASPSLSASQATPKNAGDAAVKK